MRIATLFLLLVSLAAAAALAQPAKPSPAAAYTVVPLPLPGGGDEGIAMDYLAFDPATGFVWVPAGNTGAVDVVDTAQGKVKQISGFPTAEVQFRGGKRVVGPSSAAVGEGVVYVGNRGDRSVCAVDARSLARGACGKLDSSPDGLAYVAPTKELWVTTPRDSSVRVLTVAKVDASGQITLVAQVPTRAGARNGVVTPSGRVYLAHGSMPKSSDLLVVAPE